MQKTVKTSTRSWEKGFFNHINTMVNEQLKQKKWITFDGRVVSLNEIDHQHLSNIFWHSLIVKNMTEAELKDIQETIDIRFDGTILPYSPHPSFKSEIDYLNKHRLLIIKQYVENEYQYDILFQGKIVGMLKTTEKV